MRTPWGDLDDLNLSDTKLGEAILCGDKHQLVEGMVVECLFDQFLESLSVGTPGVVALNVETAIAQKSWQDMQQQEFGVTYEMCNRLEQAFKNRLSLWKKMNEGKNFYFSADELTIEDWGNVVALRNWAREVGINAENIDFQDLMYSEDKLEFQNKEGARIDALFKLYPWEFIFGEMNFGDYEVSTTQIVEPMWKGMLSTKAILPMWSIKDFT